MLALLPKPLMEQWQAELWSLLQLPSAIWRGDGWEDEREVFHPAAGPDGLRKCPRRFGLVSTGLVRRSPDVRAMLAGMDWECVILDEAHHARRSNLGASKQNEIAVPNNLMTFMREIAPSTKSMLLATATPVQMDPIELFDLLYVLNLGNRTVLGTHYSRWLTQPRLGLDLVSGKSDPPDTLSERWEWMRDPFPTAAEDKDFGLLRERVGEPMEKDAFPPEALHRLGPPDLHRLQYIGEAFFSKHNPYIRNVVRRTREFLENAHDPETHEPYLPKVEVRLFGEQKSDSVNLPGLLSDAYTTAEEFCQEVGKRPKFNASFLQTMLLRRVGSTIAAGRSTAQRMLGSEVDQETETAEDDERDDAPTSKLHPLTSSEKSKLQEFLAKLAGAADDPKYQEVERILLHGHSGTEPWLERGCIIFSQYFDSVDWIASSLSNRLPDETIAVYAGSGKSGFYRGQVFERIERDAIKSAVKAGEIRLVIGTDAASEGLNLQRLGSLINLDLPWNPTRLEQRKGRIQRIGQPRPFVYVYNLRYRGSVEDRVHQRLSSRLAAITSLFGQLPDTLEDAWVAEALRDEAKVQQIIDAVPEVNPFELKYDRIEPVDWETCHRVLDSQTQLEFLLKGW